MPGVPLAGAPKFYRFQKRARPAFHQSARPPTALHQSAQPPIVHRILPGLLASQCGPPEPLRSAWLGGGVTRPWSGGAAVPCVADRCGLGRQRGPWARRGGRGIRAGRRVQLRRHRLDRDSRRPPYAGRPTREQE